MIERNERNVENVIVHPRMQNLPEETLVESSHEILIINEIFVVKFQQKLRKIQALRKNLSEKVTEAIVGH